MRFSIGSRRASSFVRTEIVYFWKRARRSPTIHCATASPLSRDSHRQAAWRRAVSKRCHRPPTTAGRVGGTGRTEAETASSDHNFAPSTPVSVAAKAGEPPGAIAE